MEIKENFIIYEGEGGGRGNIREILSIYESEGKGILQKNLFSIY